MRTRAAILDRATAGWTERDRQTLTMLFTRLVAGIDRLDPGTETQ